MKFKKKKRRNFIINYQFRSEYIILLPEFALPNSLFKKHSYIKNSF